MAEKLTVENYVGECIVKCAQIILSSRIYNPTPSIPDKRASRWFLLEVEELESAKQQLEPWRREPSFPIVLEIYVQPWGSKAVVTSQDGEHATGAGKMLLERWTLQYNRGSATSPGNLMGSAHAGSAGGYGSTGGPAAGGPSASPSASSSRSYVDEASVYKRMIILVRSLYSHLRVLPAFRMFRTCKRHKGELITMGYRLQPHPRQTAAAQPRSIGGSTATTSSKLQRFAFAPVDTPGGGSLSVSVEYQPAATVHILERTTTPITMPRIITDYLGSPTAASAASTAR
eukprot:CAMPEP_0202917596 /NCGR_PEP_ID=MMETSP1392-20130828/71357_1 /ASSEMBLY_ACC=CAM_ASM_000868 /TAXON_ID=225041 /ORGANISM="Chlamydomonas chlamydogama, Strain SAG 11-48b" /LENGTH=286 /DNA_ID=CAMNT_0049610389 /DNA_START=34 /DNA_END=891 /DNA_ORIENTATION=-